MYRKRRSSEKEFTHFSCEADRTSAARFCCQPLWNPFYPFPRLNGKVKVTCNGEPCVLTEECFSGFDSVRLIKQDRAALGIRNTRELGTCGRIRVNAPEQPIAIWFETEKWWSTLRFDLDISIDTVQNTVTFSGGYTQNEGFTSYDREFTETTEIGEEEISIRLAAQ